MIIRVSSQWGGEGNAGEASSQSAQLPPPPIIELLHLGLRRVLLSACGKKVDGDEASFGTSPSRKDDEALHDDIRHQSIHF